MCTKFDMDLYVNTVYNDEFCYVYLCTDIFSKIMYVNIPNTFAQTQNSARVNAIV
jgi:hypothetical protein